VFAFAHMLKFLSDKLTGLSGWSFALLGVTMRAFNYFFFWHDDFPSRVRRTLEAKKVTKPSAQGAVQSSRAATESSAFFPVRKTFVTRSSPLSRTSWT
jgi:hypothetical protein